jgi:hypothetical protein
MRNPTSPTKTCHGSVNGQDKSISARFDSTAFAGVALIAALHFGHIWH